MKFTTALCLVFFKYQCFSAAFTARDNFALENVQVLFRHGDRAALEVTVYENDPYAQIWKDIGYGQLTKNGKRRAYKLGRMLRKRYDPFLGEYSNGDVYAYSGASDRTKMSLDLALAGLYPPTARTTWSSYIHWSPIPTDTLPLPLDFLGSFEVCLKLYKLLAAAYNTPEIQMRVAKYKDFYKYLEASTKMNSSSPRIAFSLYSNLQSAIAMGLPIPDWCSEEDYQKLTDNADIFYDAMAHTDLARRVLAGPVAEAFVMHINGSETSENKKKIYLYAGHDANLAAFVRAFNFTNIPDIPAFGSAIIVEKWNGPVNDINLRMFYWTGITEKLLPLKLKDCDIECPLSKFLVAMIKLLPDDESRKLCQKSETQYCSKVPNV